MMRVVLVVSVLFCGVLSWTPPPKPNPDVLAWTKREIGAFFSFNLISEIPTAKPGYLCVGERGVNHVVPVEDFNPSLINMDEWVEVAASFGAKYAVLTAQHCSGFSMWPTDVYSATGFNYTYSIKYSPFRNGKGDIVRDFIASCKKYNIAPGIYYALNENFYLNVGHGKVMNVSTLYPGQINITQDLYNKIVLAQMRELWSNYGDLSELWFDGGCIPGLEDAINKLSTTLQPNAVYFKGCSKTNNLRWIGTESGEPSYPIWSTAMETMSGCHDGSGSVNGTVFCPAETDTTLQLSDEWFYHTGDGFRSVDILKTVYMKSVGQNTNLLLNVAANSSGLIPDLARAIYKGFGEWIQSCFGTPVAKTSGSGMSFTLQLDTPAEITKISVSEDQSDGEMVTEFRINATTFDGMTYPIVTNGQSIGNKFIVDLADGPMIVTAVELVITAAFDIPTISDFSVYQCLLL